MSVLSVYKCTGFQLQKLQFQKLLFFILNVKNNMSSYSRRIRHFCNFPFSPMLAVHRMFYGQFWNSKCTHALNVCNSFTKKVKGEIFGCKAQPSLLSSIAICLMFFFLQNGYTLTKIQCYALQAYVF